jgi:hypothetical protein
MNAKAILSFTAVAGFATVAALASTAASAYDGEAWQVALKAEDSRPRAEVKAEAQAQAVAISAHASYEGDPSPVAVLHSAVDAKAVRAEAAQANRLGQIRSGELAQ